MRLLLGGHVSRCIFERALHHLHTGLVWIVPDVVELLVAANIAVEQYNAFESFQDFFAHIVSTDEKGDLGKVRMFGNR